MPVKEAAVEQTDRDIRASGKRPDAFQWVGDLVGDNPIFLRELRRRMRGRALFVAMISYIAVMSAVAFIIVFARTVAMRAGEAVNIMPMMRQMSDELFTWVAVVQGVLVLLVGPIITAGIATAEKEKKTLDFLQVTTLRPGAFVFGALASTMLYILLVLLCALPILSITFLFGGVAPSDIAASFGSLLLLSMILSAAGLWIASLREKTRSAQSALMFVVGILIFNFLLIKAITPRMFRGGGGGSALLPFSNLAPGGAISIFGFALRSWHADIICALLVIGFLGLLAARRIFNPENRALSYWQGLVFFALAQLVLAANLWGARANQPEVIADAGLATWLLLLLSVFVYNTGRVEMGNEVWRIKRRFPFLRGIDESVLYILLLLGVWILIGHWWVGNTATAAAQPGPAYGMWWTTVRFVSISTLFTCAMARFFANLTPTRGQSFAYLLVACAALYAVVPLVLIFFVQVRDNELPSSTLRSTLSLLSFSPWVYLQQLSGRSIMDEFRTFSFGGIRDTIPLIYAFAAAAVFAFAWLFHRRKWANPDYCVGVRAERHISDEPFIHPNVFTELRGSARTLTPPAAAPRAGA